ncbi:hypothetical protein [Sessilibacter corallicola]|uniref:Uncharacterized protein n=1 Tax=Sessilibacter corallicola TaxID=2904075 RepID=A0ABQ0ADP2_9GAMM
MSNKIVRHHVPSTPLPREPGNKFVKFMSEAEIHKRAAADSDNPPIQSKDFHKFKRVNRTTGLKKN